MSKKDRQNPLSLMRINFLIIQTTAGIIALIGALIVISVVIFILKTANNKEEEKTFAKEKVYKARRWYFWGLCGILLITLLATLGFNPYGAEKSNPDMEVAVVAYQWMWRMAPGIRTTNTQDFEGTDEIDLPANKKIRFTVTANDVNHSFGIYNKDGNIIAQTQAMPGYENQLNYTFEPGEYKIICLEYCGMGHDIMTATIHVK